MCKLPYAVWFLPPACGVGRPGVLQISQPLSLSLRHGALPVVVEVFPLVPRVKNWPHRLKGVTSKRSFEGRIG